MRVITLAAALVTFACGSRSALNDFARADGGAGSGANGGSGGVTPACGFTLRPPVQLPNPGKQESAAPAFVRSLDNPEDVTLAFARREPPELTHLTFAPFGDWPPTLGFGLVAFSNTTLKDDFRITSSLPDKFAAAAIQNDIVHFAPRISQTSPGTGFTLPLLGTKPVFLSAFEDEAFVIGTLSIQRELYVQVAEPTGLEPVPIATIGCAEDDIVGGAVPFANGWLVVHSNGQNAPAAVCEPPAPATAGPATRIDIVTLAKSSITNLLTSLDTQAPVRELAVATHPDGVAFVWLDGPLQFARYVASTGQVVGPVTLSNASDSPHDVAMSAFGTGSAVTYTRAGNESVVTVLDASGNATASVVMAPNLVGRAAVVADTPREVVLLAHREVGTGSMQLTRFDCSN